MPVPTARRPRRTDAPPPGRAAPPPRRPARRGDVFGRALPWAIGASLLVHLLVFLLSPRFERVSRFSPPETIEEVRAAGPPVIDGASVVVTEGAPPLPLLAEPTPSPAAATEATLTPQPEAWQRPAAQPSQPPGTPAAGAPGAAPQPGAARDANPFARRPLDPRLRVGEREVPPPSDHERYMAQLEARLDAYNDSVAGAADAARRATDWTVRDKDGGRWGVSPGGLHLGGVTIPIPTTVQGTAEASQKAREEQRRRGEIRDQADGYDRDRAREESIRRTRERRDAERPQTGGGG
jgi:hypothetical protein